MSRRLAFSDKLTLLAGVMLLIAVAILMPLISSPPSPRTHAPIADTPSKPAPPPYQFPAGGRTLSGTYRFVAIYGSVETPLLGVLGEQSPTKSVTRVKQLAEKYAPLTEQPIYPTFEIIATVAAGSPTEDNDYSHQAEPAKIKPWVQAAKAAGVYVLLDLQPGRSSFLTQAKYYESLLREPHVGLALDPEWRLGPNELPLQQIGQASAAEINATSSWLSQLTTKHGLPQKLFLIHQFQLASLPDRHKIASRANLMTIIQMDGQGDQPTKHETWQAVTKNPPPDARFGWKNFYDEDSPTLTPAQTMKIKPTLWYVSYQ